jgi:hypothetical protein
MSKDPNSPFNWRMRKGPSIFAQDPYFRVKADGKTDSQRASDTVEARRSQGIDPGTLYGIGKQGKDKEAQILAYKHFGAYSKAHPSTKVPNKHEKCELDL